MSINNYDRLIYSEPKPIESAIDVTQIGAYPAKDIFWSYTLLGGGIGGMLVGISIILMNLSFMKGLRLSEPIAIIMLCAMAGFIVGMIPALLTGYFISRRKLILASRVDYLKIFAIGFMMASLCCLLLLSAQYVNNYFNPSLYSYHSLNNKKLLSLLQTSLLIGLVGGLSSAIVGRWFIPKAMD